LRTFPAHEYGENAAMDHEIAYIQLRDKNPGYIVALMRPDAMTIPENVVDGIRLHPASSGPVFSVEKDGYLHMRYTARPRNVIWNDDAISNGAVAELK